VHNDEWDGDTPLHLDKSEGAQSDVTGEVVFSGDKLPWASGLYEVRRFLGNVNETSLTDAGVIVEIPS
jgi:phosphatidylethanolamine N-methyltransferase